MDEREVGSVGGAGRGEDGDREGDRNSDGDSDGARNREGDSDGARNREGDSDGARNREDDTDSGADADGNEDVDPAAPEERTVGDRMVDDGSGLGSVAAHLYRGEVDRAVNWRTRLDATTNWAVTIIAGIIAYAFSSGDVSHAILLVAMVIAVVFLLIEARRFRRYDIWRSRVRSLQENLFANALDPSAGVEQRDWRRQLSEDYRQPSTKMPLRRALSHRLRRVYLPILTGLVVVWLFRLVGDEAPLLEAASVEGAPGSVVLGTVLISYAVLLGIAVWPTLSASAETDREIDLGDLDR
jgi:uncharacterized membrane protein